MRPRSCVGLFYIFKWLIITHINLSTNNSGIINFRNLSHIRLLLTLNDTQY